MDVIVRSVTQGRRLAVTRKGALALCPAKTKVDDKVAIFHGGRMPFILRRISGSEMVQSAGADEQFHLIGESFIHGIMYGDAFKDAEKHSMTENFLLV
jgi:hypothetical protein